MKVGQAGEYLRSKKLEVNYIAHYFIVEGRAGREVACGVKELEKSIIQLPTLYLKAGQAGEYMRSKGTGKVNYIAHNFIVEGRAGRGVRCGVKELEKPIA